jgi:enoyl-CoA hydratase/carnithine racemase
LTSARNQAGVKTSIPEKMMQATDTQLVIERRDAAVWITVNRPEKANAMTVDMMERLTNSIAEAAADPTVSAILVTGAGERVFCAGVDVREQPTDGDMTRQRERRSVALAALQDAVINTAKPIVAVLNGAASGGGAMLALMADACVAVESAVLSLPEIDLGIATFSGANILEVIGGRALVLDLIQSGRRMSAAEASQRGLIHAVAPQGTLVAAASTVAQSLGAKNPKVFAENKRWINRKLKLALTEAREEHARHRRENSK